MAALIGIVAGVLAFATTFPGRRRSWSAAAALTALSIAAWTVAVGGALGWVAALVTLMAAGSTLVVAVPLARIRKKESSDD